MRLNQSSRNQDIQDLNEQGKKKKKKLGCEPCPDLMMIDEIGYRQTWMDMDRDRWLPDSAPELVPEAFPYPNL